MIFKLPLLNLYRRPRDVSAPMGRLSKTSRFNATQSHLLLQETLLAVAKACTTKNAHPLTGGSPSSPAVSFKSQDTGKAGSEGKGGGNKFMVELENRKLRTPVWFLTSIPTENHRFLIPHAVKQPFGSLDPTLHFPALKVSQKKNHKVLVAVPRPSTAVTGAQHRAPATGRAGCGQESTSAQEIFHPNNIHVRNYFAFLDEQSDETRLMALFINPEKYQELKALLFSASFHSPSPNLGLLSRTPSRKIPTPFPHHLLQACSERCFSFPSLPG